MTVETWKKRDIAHTCTTWQVIGACVISKSPTTAKLLNATNARSKSMVTSSQRCQKRQSSCHTILQCDKLTMWRVDWFPTDTSDRRHFWPKTLRHQCRAVQTFPYPMVSKPFLYSNSFISTPYAETPSFKSVTDRHTNRQKINVLATLAAGKVHAPPNLAVGIVIEALEHVLAPPKLFRV